MCACRYYIYIYSYLLIYPRQKNRDMNASPFLQHCKKNRPNILLSSVPYKKDGLLLNDTWEKRWQMVEKQVLTKWCLFWGTRLSMQAKFILKKKARSNIRAKYTSVQNGGVLKRGGWSTRPHHIARTKHPWTQSSCRLFLRPRVLWLQNGGPDPLGWILRGIPLVICDIAIEHGPFIVDLPSYTMVIFHIKLLVYQ